MILFEHSLLPPTESQLPSLVSEEFYAFLADTDLPNNYDIFSKLSLKAKVAAIIAFHGIPDVQKEVSVSDETGNFKPFRFSTDFHLDIPDPSLGGRKVRMFATSSAAQFLTCNVVVTSDSRYAATILNRYSNYPYTVKITKILEHALSVVRTKGITFENVSCDAIEIEDGITLFDPKIDDANDGVINTGVINQFAHRSVKVAESDPSVRIFARQMKRIESSF